MRAFILVAIAAASLAACGKSGPVDNTTNIDQVLAAQNMSANDTTAIDAATGDDANMAADVNFTLDENLDEAAGNSDNATGNSD